MNTPGELAQRQLSWSRLALLLALTALPVLLTTLAMGLLGATGGTVALRPWLRPSYLAFLIYALANWSGFLAVFALAGTQLSFLGFRFVVGRTRFIVAVAGFLLGLLVYVAVEAFLRSRHLPTVAGMELPRPRLLEAVALVFAVVATAPLCEELFFRVLWIGALSRRLPLGVAVALSITAFAAIHYPYFGAGGVIFIASWSLIPALLFVRWRDLTAPLTMHVLNNAFAYLLVPFLGR